MAYLQSRAWYRTEDDEGTIYHWMRSQSTKTDVGHTQWMIPDAAVIHNHYPAIAEAIREAQGHASRAQRDAKHKRLDVKRRKNRELRREIEELRGKMAKLASINEMLLNKLRTRNAAEKSPNVFDLETSKS